MRDFIFTITSEHFLFLMVVSCFIFRIYWISNTISIYSYNKNESLKLYHKVENDYPNFIKIYYQASSPAHALYFGHIWDRHNSEVLQILYKSVYFYNFFNGRYYNWDTDVPFEEIISRARGKIIFQGPPFDSIFPIFYAMGLKDLKKPNLILKDVYNENDEKGETIYEVNLSSAKGSR